MVHVRKKQGQFFVQRGIVHKGIYSHFCTFLERESIAVWVGKLLPYPAQLDEILTSDTSRGRACMSMLG